jgi:hypothetical protein
MAMTARSVPLLRCFAGDVPIGLAAEEVQEFRGARPELPHIAALLGLPRGEDGAGQRTLCLLGAAGPVLINVDGPVKIRALPVSEVLALPAFFSPASIAPLLGFAEEDGRVVLLLDVPSVSRIVTARSAGDSPPQGKPSCSS